MVSLSLACAQHCSMDCSSTMLRCVSITPYSDCIDCELTFEADDMSMIVATACVLHRAWTFQQSQEYTQKFTAVLLASMAVETVYHSFMDEEFVHQASWLVLLVLVCWRTRALIRRRVQSPEGKQKLTHLIIFGSG